MRSVGSTYRKKLDKPEPKAKYVVLYSRSATFLCAAALQARRSETGWVTKAIALRRFVAADSTYLFETGDRKEADYLVALLNSPTA